MDRLMEKLALSKAIMDKAEGIKNTGSMGGGLSPTSLQQFDAPAAKYNIPAEFLQENNSVQQPYLSQEPRENTKPVGVPTVDAIKNSKLPDEIKRLMMEHPIAQPQQQNTTISNELIESARRLMKTNESGYLPESAKTPSSTKPIQQPQQTNVGVIDYKLIKKMINEAVSEALYENGLIAESTEKSNEVFNFKVGKHVFEGKITKIKKFS
jgi:hypothetical protein